MGKPLYKDRVISYCGTLADSQKRTPKGLVYIDDYGSLPKIATAAYICFQVTGPTHCYQEYSISWACEIIDLWMGDSDTSNLIKRNLNKNLREKFKFEPWKIEHSS